MNWIENFWSNSLSRIRDKALNEINRVFWIDNKELQISRKKDNSIVTELDCYISDIFKEELIRSVDEDVCFFSEEDKEKLYFPSMIIDPIDGTSQIAKGESDCCISVAFMQTPQLADSANRGWIYAPFTGFEMSTGQNFIEPKSYNKDPLIGLISKNDYKKGYFDNLNLPKNIKLMPKGSIALKLAFLAGGFCDFVLSRTDKHVWDIAAGSILLEQRGYKTYTKEGEVSTLDMELLKGPILWCRQANYEVFKMLLEY